MKRNDVDRKVVDLGKASRETRGGHVGSPEGIGLLPTFGLSRD
ncbi:benenodin family lasso peptide [Hephaestia mangrovi]|nr:benenodin family lasso peptide [Hephaestia mangrovi]MBY8829175.1 benenodin family lasso peptide [Hephaestia mangrovi]